MARVVNGKPRERYVLLFTDVLLVCTPLKGGRYLLDSVYDVADLMIRSDAKGGWSATFSIDSTVLGTDVIWN